MLATFVSEDETGDFTWDCKTRKSDSQNQEGDGHALCVREAHHQQKRGLHAKAWKKEERKKKEEESISVLAMTSSFLHTALPTLSISPHYWFHLLCKKK